MLRTMLRLPDGSEIFSGAALENVVQKASLTECVNEAKELKLGSVCSNLLEIDLQTPNGGLEIKSGEELEVYKVDESGKMYLLGYFVTESTKRTAANTLHLRAYDRVSRLDKDMSDWLAALTQWPYSLFTFANMICSACGLKLKNSSIPNGDYQVQKFAAYGVTGRKLMQWVGELAGRFCRATAEGQIEFAWYESSNVELTPDGDRSYFQNGLSYEDYTVAPIEKVHIKLTQDDVGAVWPDEMGEKNTYTISGNYLLTASSMEQLQNVAKTLYEQMKDVTYTPCKVRISAGLDIHAGQTVRITDKNGKSFLSYVMKKTQSGQLDTLECTGSQKRESTTAVNNEKYRANRNQIMELRKSEEGLEATVRDYITEETVLLPRISGQYSHAVQIKNALADSISGLTLYGKTTQDGTPTPESPVELVSPGASGAISTTVAGKNISNPKTFTSSPNVDMEFVTDNTIRAYTTVDGKWSALYLDTVAFLSGVTYVLSADVLSCENNVIVCFRNSSDNIIIKSTVINTPGKAVVKYTPTKDTRGYASILLTNGATVLSNDITVNNIQLEIGTESTEYEPYKEAHTLTVSTPNGLPGIPVSSGGNYTDENGQQWICDEIDFARGVHVQRVKRTTVSQMPFGYNGTNFYCVTGDKKPGVLNLLCSHYPVRNELVSVGNMFTKGDVAANTVYIKDTSYTSVDSLKSVIGEAIFLYELAAPIETALPEEELAAFAALGNPEGKVTAYSDADMKIGLAGMASVSSVQNAREAADKAQTGADGANEQILSIHESISELVVGADAIRVSVQNAENAIDSVSGDLQTTKSEMTAMKLESNALSVEIQKMNKDGVNKVTTTAGIFDEDGLTVDSTDSPTKTQITPDGMTVYQKSYGSTTAVLTATSDGVDAMNLHAKTYLIVGGRSRFENYGSDRTGCFWIGE